MPKSTKARPTASSAASAAKSAQQASGDPKGQKVAPPSKQSRVIAMLQSPGATIAAMMKATGWQPHSVRGFLAGVVRKRLKLKLGSRKVDGERVYQIAGADRARSATRSSKQRAA